MAPRTLDLGTDELLCSVENRIATITLNRPEKRNALGDTLTPALREALLRVEADPEVRAVIITGAGTAFCAGGDVTGLGRPFNEGAADAPRQSADDAIRGLQHKQDTLTLRLYHLATPTIAVLPGPAAGAGMSIALACDIRIAAQSAFLAPGFVNIGLSGDYGGSWFLTRLVGSGRAREIYFTGRRVDAAEAHRLGIFNEVVPDTALAARARELAGAIAAGPPVALRYMKENFNRAGVADLKTCLDMEADRTIRSARTEDHLEGVAAFMAKRKPQFAGR
ncbi:MAG: enoyl-CoA hydratase [Rhodospirillaceae bacterium]|nr:enoyl-CoA hydratase [Rhodospirillaceae bacterium]MYB13349.1 enoyl-CoA hydratase [Rhodospirillaceae bacterium]MYI50829.1 enoyl-CoA hydratase [Rhodospirillaceae bacterium]